MFGVAIAIWATYFNEKWKQRQNEMRIQWDLHHFESKVVQNSQYHGDNIVDENTEMIDTRDYFPVWKRRLFATDFPLMISAVGFIFFNTWVNEKVLDKVSETNNERDNTYYTQAKM